MDTVNKLKQELLAELNVQYKNLINSLRAMPVSDNFKNPGFLNLDQGLMWFEKGIHLIQVQTAAELPPNEEPKTVDEIKPETIQ